MGVVRVKVAELLRSTTPERVSQAMQQTGLDAAAAAELQQVERRVRLLGEQFVQAGGDEVWLVLSLAHVRAGAPLIIVRRCCRPRHQRIRHVAAGAAAGTQGTGPAGQSGRCEHLARGPSLHAAARDAIAAG